MTLSAPRLPGLPQRRPVPALDLVRREKAGDVPSRGALTLGDIGLIFDACLAGEGIARVLALGTAPPLPSAASSISSPTGRGRPFPVHAVYPSRHQPPAEVRAFLDLCPAAVRDFGP